MEGEVESILGVAVFHVGFIMNWVGVAVFLVHIPRFQHWLGCRVVLLRCFPVSRDFAQSALGRV